MTGVIKVSKHPHGIAASPDKSRLYVPSEEEGVLDVVDLATSKVIRRVPGAGAVHALGESGSARAAAAPRAI